MKFAPQLVIFDVDGVLVDVHGSFHRTIIDTVHHFTKHRPTYADIQTWKRRTGYNDDWRLSTDWVKELGGDADYAKVKRQFQKFYWGVNKKGRQRLARALAGAAAPPRALGEARGTGAFHRPDAPRTEVHARPLSRRGPVSPGRDDGRR